MPAIAPSYSTNRVVRLENAYQIVEHWGFLVYAMEQLNDPRRANAGYTPESFFNTLLRVTSLNEDGLVCLLLSKNGKYLGFGCGFTATTFDFETCFYIWQAYSNSLCKTALSELLSHCERYAKNLGHTTVKASTPRTTGAANRFFEGILGFNLECFSYTKKI